MAFVRQFDAQVTVLHQGRVLVEGPLAAVQKDERVIEVYLGRLDKAEAEAARMSDDSGTCVTSRVGYGDGTVLADVNLAVERGPGAVPARAQRRRQDDADQNGHRLAAAASRAGAV